MKINYISWLANELGKSEEIFEISEPTPISRILESLASREINYKSDFFKVNGIVRVAINGLVVDREYIVSNNQDIVLFAPMSGG